MSRQLRLYLDDIVNSICKIEKYTKALTYDEFISDEKTLDAVIHNLLIIGEATKQIPSEIRIKYPQIQWQQIAGMRDIIAHAYFTINTRIVWNVIPQELNLLKTCIETIINTETLG